MRNLGETASEFGNKVLLMYGKGSVMKNGSYEQVIGQLAKVNARIYEYNGIKPNPLIDDVDSANRSSILKKVQL